MLHLTHIIVYAKNVIGVRCITVTALDKVFTVENSEILIKFISHLTHQKDVVFEYSLTKGTPTIRRISIFSLFFFFSKSKIHVYNI